MMEENNKKIYTIGYAAHTIDSFISTLKKFKINALADVRSHPYSKYKPEFNREDLNENLSNAGIKYVFLGDNIGARIKAPECYKNGQVVYDLISRHPLFQAGIDRLIQGMDKYSIALMCAEKDPVNCHRTILICKYLKRYQMQIFHILDINKIEKHSDTEHRLMKSHNMEQPNLFLKDAERLERAYSKQEEKIAYIAENEVEY